MVVEVEPSWHAEEMKLASRRKEAWLENRGRVVTWLLEPCPVSFWLGSTIMGLTAGLTVGLLVGVEFLA